MSEKKEKILVFMKPHYTDIEAFLLANFDCRIFKGDWGDPFPKFMYTKIDSDGRKYSTRENIDCDWIFSFLCPWKIPKEILSLAKKGAINFHPGPPKYPGIGCYNYAIWNEDQVYGVLAHYMDKELDHGKIIKVRSFELIGNETINTLKNRAIVELKKLFYDLMEWILRGDITISESQQKWGKYKSKEDFDACCRVEIQSGFFYGLGTFNLINYEERWEKFLRAFYYPGASEGPYIEINGKKWRLVPK